MWFAFAIVLVMTANGPQVQGAVSPTPYASEAECVVANKAVEESAFKQAKPDPTVVAYSFQCKKLGPEDFKKPGLDA